MKWFCGRREVTNKLRNHLDAQCERLGQCFSTVCIVEIRHLGARHLGADIWALCHMGARTFGRQDNWARNTCKRIFNQLFVGFFLINENYFVSATILSNILLNFLFATIS